MKTKKQIIESLEALRAEKEQYVFKMINQGNLLSPFCMDFIDYETLIKKVEIRISVLEWVLK